MLKKLSCILFTFICSPSLFANTSNVCDSLKKRIGEFRTANSKLHRDVVDQTRNTSTVLEIFYGNFRQLYGTNGPVQAGYFDGMVTYANLVRANADSYSEQVNQLDTKLTDIIIDLATCSISNP